MVQDFQWIVVIIVHIWSQVWSTRLAQVNLFKYSGFQEQKIKEKVSDCRFLWGVSKIEVFDMEKFEIWSKISHAQRVFLYEIFSHQI